MQQNNPAEACDSGRLLAKIDEMLADQPHNRATILTRLREAKPALYTLWLMRTIARTTAPRPS